MTAPRKPGRPRLDPSDTSVNVCLSVPGKLYNELATQASRYGVSIAAIVRARLRIAARARAQAARARGGREDEST
jgi:hypothetical protein